VLVEAVAHLLSEPLEQVVQAVMAVQEWPLLFQAFLQPTQVAVVEVHLVEEPQDQVVLVAGVLVQTLVQLLHQAQ